MNSLHHQGFWKLNPLLNYTFKCGYLSRRDEMFPSHFNKPVYMFVFYSKLCNGRWSLTSLISFGPFHPLVSTFILLHCNLHCIVYLFLLMNPWNKMKWRWSNICSSNNCSCNDISGDKEKERGLSIIGLLVQGRVRIRVMVMVMVRIKVKVKVLPMPNMVHRAAPISVSITLGHTSAECSESYSRGLVHW